LEASAVNKEEAHMAKRKRLSGYPDSGRREAPSLRLGDFILGETPYPSPKYPSPTAAEVKTYGPGMNFNTDRPFDFPDVRSPKAARNKKKLTKPEKTKILRAGLFWKIGGVERRMSKAIRIPYTYFDHVAQKYAKTALVIGYEGAGGGC